MTKRKLSVSLVGSVVAHLALVLLAFLLFRGGGGGGGGGEEGHSGAGDTAIDVTLASPGAEATPPSPPTPPTTAPTPTVAPASPPTAVPAHEVAPTKPEETDPNEPGKTLPPLAALPRQSSSTAKPSNEPSTGRDATTNGGRLPGRIGAGIDGSSIEGQRALLPRAASCDDPVAGKWEALKFVPGRFQWVRFLLNVKRDGTSVHGNILSRSWSGTAFDSVPPPCVPGGYDLTVTMPASGRTNGVTISFGASRYSVVAETCSTLVVDYYPDNFSGVLDSARQEF
ncbi:MAG: hypothetical protein ABI551_12365, partial [Polyangiaceae bacterium]